MTHKYSVYSGSILSYFNLDYNIHYFSVRDNSKIRFKVSSSCLCLASSSSWCCCERDRAMAISESNILPPGVTARPPGTSMSPSGSLCSCPKVTGWEESSSTPPLVFSAKDSSMALCFGKISHDYLEPTQRCTAIFIHYQRLQRRGKKYKRMPCTNVKGWITDKSFMACIPCLYVKCHWSRLQEDIKHPNLSAETSCKALKNVCQCWPLSGWWEGLLMCYFMVVQVTLISHLCSCVSSTVCSPRWAGVLGREPGFELGLDGHKGLWYLGINRK